MRRRLFRVAPLLVLGLALASPARASMPWELTLTGGYRLGGTWGKSTNASGTVTEKWRVAPSAQWGLLADVQLDSRWWAGLSWDRQSSELEAEKSTSSTPGVFFPLNLDYITANLTYTYPKPPWVPFLSAGIGVANYNPVDNAYQGEFRLHWQFSGGTKYLLGDRYLVRLQGRLRSVSTPDAADLFCALGGTCGVPVSASWMWQLDGLVGFGLRF